MTDRRDEPVFVAGHNGMVGRAIVRHLAAAGYTDIVTRDRRELDLCDQAAVAAFFDEQRIGSVYLAAARVGGIVANASYPAEFLYQNLAIQTNVVHAAHRTGVERLLFLGSSCIYPKHTPQPMSEEALLTGTLEPTNEAYAIAKIAGIKLCEAYRRQYGRDYRSVMPTNLYGPFDNFHPEHSHVIPGLMMKFDRALRENMNAVTIWGTGTPRREFLHVDDMASACHHVMTLDRERYEAALGESASYLNVGTGEDIEIGELAVHLREVSGFPGEIDYDRTKPDGTPRKWLDVSRLRSTGWQPSVALDDGLRSTWQWFREHAASVRQV